jgi:YVTN family beta-propeller protein
LLGAALVVAMVTGLAVNATGQTRPPAAPAPTASATPAGVPRSSARPVLAAALAVGRDPEGVAVSPDGRTAYVADQGSHEVVAVDTARLRVRARLPLPSTPRFVAVSPDGRRAYVSMFAGDGSGSGVAVLDTGSGTVLGVVRTGPKPYALAVAPDGRVWVPVHEAGRIEVIDGERRAVVGTIRVPASPHAVAFGPGGRRAYTADHESNVVSVLDRRRRTVLGALRVDRSPHHLAVSGDGTLAVANYDAGTVNLVAPDGRMGRPIRVGRNPQSVGFAADGGHAYVVDEGDGTVSVVDVAARRVSATVRVGSSPRSVAVAPDGRTAYVTVGGAGQLGVLRLA